jgi:glycosyltransferase involved in cell wall biosynthesis
MASAGSRKVLFIVENLPSPFDRRVWQEATTLRDNGFTVSIICPTGKGFEKKFEIIDGIAIYRHNLPTEGSGALGYLVEYSAALFWEFWLAWKALRQRGFDVIHACNPPDDIFLVGGFFKIFLRKKFLFDHHDINPELYLAKFGKKDFLYKLMVFLERMTFRTADVSIATNESYKKIAIERGKMPANKVFVVRSGPSLERMKIQAPVPELKHGREFLVGYVGVMGKQEGLQYLLQAAQYIVETLRRNDIQFGIVGGGTELDSLRREAKDMGLEEFVTFTGRVPDKEMLDMLNTADVCVNPDVYNEMNDKSTMNKIMEYMSLGKPIVQFDLTEGRFSAGEASLYAERNDFVSLANKIVDLIDDPEKRKTMGEFGRRRIEQELEWKYEAPKLLAAYDALWPDKSA